MIIQRRWVGILLLLLAVAALGFGLYSLNKPGFIASFQDGSTVRLVGVTVGTNSFTSEPWWYPIARRVLPGSYRMRLVRIFSSGPHGYPNGISIWLELSGSITNKNPSTDRLSATFIDDSGDGVRDLGLSVDPVSRGDSRVVDTLCFPRRQSSFVLRLSYGTNQQIADLRVPNPLRGPYPQWEPEKLPVTKTNGELAVTLKQIKKQLNYWSYGSLPRTSAVFQPEFEIAWNGVVTSNWVLGPCILEDATGNWMGGPYPGLPSHESAWKLKAMFSRWLTNRFAGDERVSAGNLALPREGTFSQLNVQTNLQGITVWLLGWAGPGQVTLSNGIPIAAVPQHTAEHYRQIRAGYTNFGIGPSTWMETINLGRPTLFMAHSSIEISTQISPVFTDSQGNQMRVAQSSYLGSQAPHGSRSNAMHSFVQPELATNMTPLSLNVIVQRMREFEFYIAPPTNHIWIGKPPT